MKEKTYEKRTIERRYEISSGEFKEFLGIKGEIISIVLLKGRCTNDIEKGVSADTDRWEIITKE